MPAELVARGPDIPSPMRRGINSIALLCWRWGWGGRYHSWAKEQVDVLGGSQHLAKALKGFRTQSNLKGEKDRSCHLHIQNLYLYLNKLAQKY